MKTSEPFFVCLKFYFTVVSVFFFNFLPWAHFCSPPVLINISANPVQCIRACILFVKNCEKRANLMMQMFVLFHLSSAVVCPKLTVPDNGGVVPSSCSQADVEYGTRCVFYCGDGYALRGPRYTRCQDDTSWSEIAPLSCVRGQFISMQGGHYKLSQTVPTV